MYDKANIHISDKSPAKGIKRKCTQRKGTVLVCFSVAITEHTNNSLEEKTLCSTHISTHSLSLRKPKQELKAGIWRQEQNKDHGGMLITDLLPASCSGPFITQPRDVPTHSGQCLSTSISN